jgi:hypothetical protein
MPDQLEAEVFGAADSHDLVPGGAPTTGPPAGAAAAVGGDAEIPGSCGDALVPGSLRPLTHPAADAHPATTRGSAVVMRRSTESIHPRDRAEVVEPLAGVEVVEPAAVGAELRRSERLTPSPLRARVGRTQ